jgi:hypothetical protein
LSHEILFMTIIFKRFLMVFCLTSFFFSLTFSSSISSCGLITTPGSYTLTNNLSSSSGNCLVISTSNVSLDCQSYSIIDSGSS